MIIAGSFLAGQIDVDDFNEGLQHRDFAIPFNLQNKYEIELQNMAGIIIEYGNRIDVLKRMIREVINAIVSGGSFNQDIGTPNEYVQRFGQHFIDHLNSALNDE